MAHHLRSTALVLACAVAAILIVADAVRAAEEGGGRRGGGGRGGGGEVAEAPAPPPPPPATPGEAVFRDSCSICHSDKQGAPTIIAPNLFGIVGRKSGEEAGFFYSPAMKQANLTWNDVTLMAFLTSPQQVVPGTTMGLVGLLEVADRENVIEYLNTLK
jgi:cytochrome c